MKLGLFTAPLPHMTLEEALAWLSARGVQTVELGTRGPHLYPDDYLDKPEKIAELKALLAKYNMEISALSCHGNCVHPKAEVAAADQECFEKTVRLAQQLGIDTILTFSGCPGGCPEDKTPNWVTCAWPDDFQEIADYQWNQVLIPYWKEAVAFANAHGIYKIGLEMHPGFCVYNVDTLLRLREAVGDTIGANFDPSHLIWQGMDLAEAVRALGKAIYHVHAKDTYLDEGNIKRSGVLSWAHYSNAITRPWTFRTVGYGITEKEWKAFVSMLRLVGYEGALSIEHEDLLMSIEEGLEKAIAFLRDIITFDDAADMWWA
ncbi:MAG: sugar phosphate isomerase/epimerase [Clostridia bacterium]|nr:sugar phosphate isomerase/epimerase [Clostridia bacterium]